MTPPMLRPLSVGEILDTAFSLYRRHFGALATVAAANLPFRKSCTSTASPGRS